MCLPSENIVSNLLTHTSNAKSDWNLKFPYIIPWIVAQFYQKTEYSFLKIKASFSVNHPI